MKIELKKVLKEFFKIKTIRTLRIEEEITPNGKYSKIKITFYTPVKRIT